MSAPLLRRAAASLPHILRSLPRTCRHRAPRIPAIAGARRELHELRPLRYPTDEPLGNFMSAAQLRIVAVEYQQGLLDRLNDEIKGTEWESKGIVETVIETAANREHSLIFNYASQVLNNSFFLDSLVPQTQPNWNMIDHEFAADIEQNFGSVTQFMSYMSAAAMGMSGSGWVWLVVDAQNRLATVATYGSGTMLIRARQQVNPSTVKGDPLLFGGAAAGELTQRGPVPEGATESGKVDNKDWSGMGQREPTATVKAENFRFFGQDLNPIMCISVHEHAWLHDYGVWGKEEYLKRFWAVVDWNKVSRHHERWTMHYAAAPGNVGDTAPREARVKRGRWTSGFQR